MTELQEKTVQLYQKGEISVGKGAEILGISQREFMQLLKDRGVPLSIDWEETRRFIEELNKRSQEAKEHPEKLVPLEDI